MVTFLGWKTELPEHTQGGGERGSQAGRQEARLSRPEERLDQVAPRALPTLQSWLSGKGEENITVAQTGHRTDWEERGATP